MLRQLSKRYVKPALQQLSPEAKEQQNRYYDSLVASTADIKKTKFPRKKNNSAKKASPVKIYSEAEKLAYQIVMGELID